MTAKIQSVLIALFAMVAGGILSGCRVSTIPEVTNIEERVLVGQAKEFSVQLYNDYSQTILLLEESVPSWIKVGGLDDHKLEPGTMAQVSLTASCGSDPEVRAATVILRSRSGDVSKSINVELQCYDSEIKPQPIPNDPVPPRDPAPPQDSAPPLSPLGPQPISGDGRDGAYYVSPSGSDSASGSISKPLRTIEEAASRARPGEIIYIREGVYPRTKIHRVRGKPGAPITFRAFPGERAVLDGYRKGEQNKENNVLWLFENVSNVVFDGLEITDTNPDIDKLRQFDLLDEGDAKKFLREWASRIGSSFPMGVRINPNGADGDIHSIVFKNMKFHHLMSLGMSIQNATKDVTIENCYFAGLGYPRSGYAVYTHNVGFTFRNNIVHDATYALHIFSEHEHHMSDVLIENNLIYNIGWWPFYHISSKRIKPPGGRAILLDKYGDGAVIRNNIIHNSRNAVKVNNFTNTLVEHNLIYDGNNGFDISSQGVDLVNNIAHSLKQIVYGKYKPQRSDGNLEIPMELINPERVEDGVTGYEKAIDKGVPSAATKDILGKSRSLGAAPDAGPFEIR